MNLNIMSHRVTVSPTAISELDAILEVYRQCEDFLALGPVDHASKEMVEQDLQHSREQGGVFCGIFDVYGRMIGVMDYIPDHFEGDPTTAFLELLMIAKPDRKLGIGKVVFEAFEQEIVKNHQIKTIRAGVQVNNPLAIKFWQSCGFRIVSGPTLMPDQTTVYSLKKDIMRD